MADYGLFVGWGQVPRGKEMKALDVFRDTLQYYAGLQEKGDIESFEPVILEPHGGDLLGFVLIRGERDKVARLRVDREFQRRVLRAGLIVDNFGVIGATVGGTVGEDLVTYQQELEGLT